MMLNCAYSPFPLNVLKMQNKIVKNVGKYVRNVFKKKKVVKKR